MADTFVTVERSDDGVAVIRLDRPKMNALSTALLAQLAPPLVDDEPKASSDATVLRLAQLPIGRVTA